MKFVLRKSGSAVFLMEMMVVILFFSLSVMIIFRLFVSAHLNGEDSMRLNYSLLEAKNAVELFKANGTDIFDDGSWTAEKNPETGIYRYTKNSPEGGVATSAYILEMKLTKEATPLGMYESGEMRAYAYVNGIPEGDPFLILQIGHYRQTSR